MRLSWIPIFVLCCAASATAQTTSTWLTLSGELRGRAEAYTGLGFQPDHHDAYYLHRLRLNAGLRLLPWLRTFVQVQDSQAPGYSRKPVPSSVANTLDLRQAYVQLGSTEEAGWGLRAGRQLLVFGDMRLVSTSNWGNVGPGYDALRLSYKGPKYRLDWFASTLVTAVNGKFDRPRADRRLHGFYGSFDNWIPGSTVQPYFFWKQIMCVTDARLGRGRLDVYTYGVHALGKLKQGFDYNLEMAGQDGNMISSPIRAWGGHWEIGRTLGKAKTAPRLSGEYNYATGNNDPQGRRFRTFDNLYPTDKYGTADGIAWRNIHEPIGNIEWKPTSKLRIKGSYHGFWLATRQDALYAIAGAVLALNPKATSSRVGSEADVRVIYQMNSRLQLWGGYGRMWTGPFLRQSGKPSAINYPYMMCTFAF